MSKRGLFPSGFPTKIIYAILIFPMRATRPAHLILLDSITLIIFDEAYKLRSTVKKSVRYDTVTHNIMLCDMYICFWKKYLKSQGMYLEKCRPLYSCSVNSQIHLRAHFQYNSYEYVKYTPRDKIGMYDWSYSLSPESHICLVFAKNIKFEISKLNYDTGGRFNEAFKIPSSIVTNMAAMKS
jgi:hypothetical protein